MSDIVDSFKYVEEKIEGYLGNGATDIIIITLGIILGIIYVWKTFFPKDNAPSSHNSGISFGDNAKVEGFVIQASDNSTVTTKSQKNKE